ncbi:TonB-dependent receptor [Alteromonas pelagimontana]|uniref:TonB-dependent receptor n=1 Tax=Alteromonas pelagimontana TaxID=1858656 RepID=A0A6M4MD20_9ALTE|nr:TonB-dependent receptor [Alteromonas pelagimontana]QJR81084.1 TonB-dependent receptor [Alteromonas pelagimontana]
MRRKTRMAALISALLPAVAMAQSIEGVVNNSSGKAVAGATVEIEGTKFKTKTDENGRFLLENLTANVNEFHIFASGYAHLHQEIAVAQDGSKEVTLTLKRSPIEVVDVVASPMHMSIMESASPVSVLAGETLRRQQASTLGDSLEKLPGVHTNFHANVASTPVIRGLSGPRVLIAQNGLDVSDVSRVGPDHSVATEASTAQQIEVLRGPATLFYGSGAIGGVVNVVDGRVPPDTTTRGEWLLETNSVDDKKLASFNITTGTETIGVYADGYWRESNDYDVPVAPELDNHEQQDFVVKNSGEKSNGVTLGVSKLLDNGYVGIAVERFNREYGIPGHTHGDEHEAEGSEEESVYADLKQTRVQLLSELNIGGKWIRKINTRAAFTDYEHAEIEDGMVGTLFENSTEELRFEALHNPFDGWNGGISFQYKHSDVAAQGSEAFTPPSEAQTLALAIMEEKHFGDFLLQLGGRVERVELEADQVLLPELDAHAHAGEEHNHEHGHEEATSTRVFSTDHEFTPVSLSAGLVWDFTPGYNIGISVSRSERAPSASELLSFGPHIGTRTYEIGALFAVENHDDHAHIGLTEAALDLETANNIDLTFRKTDGDVGFVFNAFYNVVDNYYYQTSTGLFAEAAHDHGGEDEHDNEEHVHATELPIYTFQTDDVILHGFEAQIAWQATDELKASFFSDYVRARLKDGGDLPRTPPLRFGTQFSYQTELLTANLDVTRYQEQDRIASYETSTDGYTLVDATVSYDLSLLDQDMMVYLKGSNLTDTEARVHTSFLKDIAPRPGRSFAIGVRGYF